MLGFYNYTVIITYLSMAAAIRGMVFAFSGNIKGAIICLLISGLCDMSDGAVARTRKRTDREKKFGIQIDSLCDLVSFGVHPAVIVYATMCLGHPDNRFLKVLALAVGICFALCAVIRLAYFNVCEEERQNVEGNKKRTSYQGLPVTNISLIMPILYLSRAFLDYDAFSFVLLGGLAITAFLFILDFKMFKATIKQEIVIGLFGVLVAIGVFLI